MEIWLATAVKMGKLLVFDKNKRENTKSESFVVNLLVKGWSGKIRVF